MGSLLIVTGPPGAGKSTVAGRIAEHLEPSVLVEGDAFFGFLNRGAIEPWLSESRAQNEVVAEAAAMATGRFVAAGYETVYDGVVGPWSLTAFVSSTGLDRVDYVILMPDVEDCVERVRHRRDHGFTDEDATRKMHHDFTVAAIEDRHVWKTVLGDPDAVAEAIIEARDQGILTFTVPPGAATE